MTPNEPAAQPSAPATETIDRLCRIIRDGDDLERADLGRTWFDADGVHPSLYRATAGVPEQDLASHEGVARLFGLWHRLTPHGTKPDQGSGTVGAFARRLANAADYTKGIENRFQSILVVDARVAVVHELGGLLLAARTEGVRYPPQWAGLIDDLAGWDDLHNAVQTKWAADFWQPAANQVRASK